MDIKQIGKQVRKTKIFQILKATSQHWQSVNASQLAAALAYHTIFSLAPLLIISIYVAGFILGQGDVQQYISERLQGLVGSQATDLVLSMVRNLRAGNSGLVASIIGFATLIFGATRVFNQLEISLNIIFETEQEKGSGIVDVLRKRGLAFAMMASFSLLMLLSVLFSTGLSLAANVFSDLIPQWRTVMKLLNYSMPVIMATVLFTLTFKLLTVADFSWRNTLIGGLLTALLFSIGQILISAYLGSSSISSAYGAAGSLLVILVWIYYSAQIFYFGAAFTKAYSEFHRKRNDPSPA